MNFSFDIKINSESCICTRFDRYNLFFPLWIHNAINYNVDIIIFLDKYSQNSKIINYISIFKNKHNISIIDISSIENFYKINSLLYFRTIFNKLYSLGYKNIICTDPDEILLTNNLKFFLNSDLNYAASQGFEMVHNFEIEKEDYDLNKTLLDQRNFGAWSDASMTKETSKYNKMVIFKNGFLPNNPGRHALTFVDEWKIWKDLKIEDPIFLLHLREIDISTMIDNSNKTKDLYSKCHKHHSFDSKQEITERLKKWFFPNLIEIPQEIKKIIIKHKL